MPPFILNGRQQMLLVRPAIVIDRIASHSSASHRHRVLEALCGVHTSPSFLARALTSKCNDMEGRPVKEDEWEDELCIAARIFGLHSHKRGAHIDSSPEPVTRAPFPCRPVP